MRHPIMTGRWWAAAGIRSVKTFAQTTVGLVGADLLSILQVDWGGIAAVGATASLVSLLTSLAGLPELEDGTEQHGEEGEAR